MWTEASQLINLVDVLLWAKGKKAVPLRLELIQPLAEFKSLNHRVKGRSSQN